MLLILSTVLGFIGPFIPELIKWFNRKQDNAHELAMAGLQMQIVEKQASYRLQEVTLKGNLDADIAETKGIYSQPHSFGVQLLDAAHKTNLPMWAIFPVFWAFALVDLLNASVRPTVTYWVVGFYLFYKWSLLSIAREATESWQKAVVANWSENDHAMMMLCLGYFFGQRAAKAAFGGSASTGRPGGG